MYRRRNTMKYDLDSFERGLYETLSGTMNLLLQDGKISGEGKYNLEDYPSLVKKYINKNFKGKSEFFELNNATDSLTSEVFKILWTKYVSNSRYTSGFRFLVEQVLDSDSVVEKFCRNYEEEIFIESQGYIEKGESPNITISIENLSEIIRAVVREEIKNLNSTPRYGDLITSELGVKVSHTKMLKPAKQCQYKTLQELLDIEGITIDRSPSQIAAELKNQINAGKNFVVFNTDNKKVGIEVIRNA